MKTHVHKQKLYIYIKQQEHIITHNKHDKGTITTMETYLYAYIKTIGAYNKHIIQHIKKHVTHALKTIYI